MIAIQVPTQTILVALVIMLQDSALVAIRQQAHGVPLDRQACERGDVGRSDQFASGPSKG